MARERLSFTFSRGLLLFLHGIFLLRDLLKRVSGPGVLCVDAQRRRNLWNLTIVYSVGIFEKIQFVLHVCTCLTFYFENSRFYSASTVFYLYIARQESCALPNRRWLLFDKNYTFKLTFNICMVKAAFIVKLGCTFPQFIYTADICTSIYHKGTFVTYYPLNKYLYIYVCLYTCMYITVQRLWN